MSEFLDDLARSMARPMPRRRALGLVGGALLTVATPALLSKPARASTAVPQACTGCGVAHGAGCVLNMKCGSKGARGFPVCCTVKGYLGPFKNPEGGLCAQAGGQLNPPGGLACCCPAGTRCGVPPGEPICVAECIKCGLDCCKPGEHCANFAQKLCCKKLETGCGPRCCKRNEQCLTIRVSTGSERVCEKRCRPGRSWCGGTKCCPKGSICANRATGRCSPQARTS